MKVVPQYNQMKKPMTVSTWWSISLRHT